MEVLLWRLRNEGNRAALGCKVLNDANKIG